ncbi:hypothetical protein 8014-B2_0074 [Lactobacillus phage ATCC 8014-B2]|uniref:Uncharacterized protein n=1 Tax=Lactobacillus phage ATCC 8014-B2 TaxID=1225795 RepID=K4HZT0_9CAUD|nr:hypothetical protein HOQ89_gp072 [Lactobacillus phage ATCC 8014-B2]AFU63141.1 hypothetical protein 8014-B2_0074 [Lactobacillus phage ATCC 8014-B2]
MTGEITMYRKFEGALDGVTIDELKQLFFEKYYDQGHSADERVEDVKKFISENNNHFLEDYCSSQYLAKTPSEQVMSENDNVLHFMEMMSTYIITGEDEEYPFDKKLFATNL